MNRKTEHSASPCGKTKKFTLVELLIVIAIIATLSGMLLPALNSAREKGRISTCVGNLKQFSSYAIFYTDDNDGWYAAGEWRRQLWDYLKTGIVYDTTRNYTVISRYSKLRCPTVPRKTREGNEINITYNIAGVSYLPTDGSYQGFAARDGSGAWVRRVRNSMVRMPSQKGYMGDYYTISHNYVIGWQDSSAANQRILYTPHYRTRGTLLFVDGHVENGSFPTGTLAMDAYGEPTREFKSTYTNANLFRPDTTLPWR